MIVISEIFICIISVCISFFLIKIFCKEPYLHNEKELTFLNGPYIGIS
jgi:hypothetical protein